MPSETPPAFMDHARAMPVDGFLEAVSQVSVDALMDRFTPQVQKDFAKEREQVAALAAKFFLGEGRPVLEWLLNISLRRPMILPNLGPEAVAFCAHREGQNNLAWQVLQAIAQGRGETPPAREGV